MLFSIHQCKFMEHIGDTKTYNSLLINLTKAKTEQSSKICVG